MKKDYDIYPYILGLFIVVYFALHLGHAVEINYNLGKKTLTDFLSLFNSTIFNRPLIFTETILNKSQTITVAVSITLIYLFYIFIDIDKKRKFRRKGEEHGSGRLGSLKELNHLINKNASKNFILSERVRLSINHFKTGINLNTIVFGGSGSGKSRYIVSPNILQANASYIITDPKGELLENTGAFLASEGYKIKVFNLVDMEYSHKYNPFYYINKEEEIYILIDNLIKNTDGGAQEKANKGDPFWENSEKALLSSIMFYVWKELPKEEQTFSKVLEIVQSYKDLDNYHIHTISTMQDSALAKINYKTVMSASDKTLDSIIVSAAVRLSLMNVNNIKNLMSKDEMNIGSFGDTKTALFIIIPDTNGTFNFIVSMFYTQIFQTLINKADNAKTKKEKKLKFHTRFILDEFANIGKIPDIEKMNATVRSRNISITFILQDLSQLKTMYKDTWESIIGNCNSLIFLGGTEHQLLKYLSEKLGKETIKSKNRGTSKSKTSSVSFNENLISRSVLTPDELETKPNHMSLIAIAGHHAILDNKFKLENHVNYKKTGFYSDKYIFNLKEFFGKNQNEVSLSEKPEFKKDLEGIVLNIPLMDTEFKPKDIAITADSRLLTVSKEGDIIEQSIFSELKEKIEKREKEQKSQDLSKVSKSPSL